MITIDIKKTTNNAAKRAKIDCAFRCISKAFKLKLTTFRYTEIPKNILKNRNTTLSICMYISPLRLHSYKECFGLTNIHTNGPII